MFCRLESENTAINIGSNLEALHLRYRYRSVQLLFMFDLKLKSSAPASPRRSPRLAEAEKEKAKAQANLVAAKVKEIADIQAEKKEWEDMITEEVGEMEAKIETERGWRGGEDGTREARMNGEARMERQA